MRKIDNVRDYFLVAGIAFFIIGYIIGLGPSFLSYDLVYVRKYFFWSLAVMMVFGRIILKLLSEMIEKIKDYQIKSLEKEIKSLNKQVSHLESIVKNDKDE